MITWANHSCPYSFFCLGRSPNIPTQFHYIFTLFFPAKPLIYSCMGGLFHPHLRKKQKSQIQSICSLLMQTSQSHPVSFSGLHTLVSPTASFWKLTSVHKLCWAPDPAENKRIWSSKEENRPSYAFSTRKITSVGWLLTAQFSRKCSGLLLFSVKENCLALD